MQRAWHHRWARLRPRMSQICDRRGGAVLVRFEGSLRLRRERGLCLAGKTPARLRTAFAAGAGQIVTAYLRDAQAYMLISMPTDTSTIFGVFQVIRVSQLTCK